MHSSSRIVTAEEVVSFEPFALDLLTREDGRSVDGEAGRGAGRAAGSEANQQVTPGSGSFDDAFDDPRHDGGYGHGDNRGASGEQSYRAGYRDGFRDGEAQALAQCEARDKALGATLQDRTEVLLKSLEAEFQGFQANHADRIVELALVLARQIVRRELEVDQELILPLVHEALDQLRETPGSATLFLDPLDAVLVGERLAPLLAQRRITVTPDPGIEPGGCRLVSQDAEVDATLPTRWQRLLAAMGREADGESYGRGGHDVDDDHDGHDRDRGHCSDGGGDGSAGDQRSAGGGESAGGDGGHDSVGGQHSVSHDSVGGHASDTGVGGAGDHDGDGGHGDPRGDRFE